MAHEDNTQNARAASLIVGALVGVVGMATENSVLIYIAMGILAVGIVMARKRRIQKRKDES